MSTIDQTSIVRVEASASPPASTLRLAISISRRAMVASLEHGSVRELLDRSFPLAAEGPDVQLVLEVDQTRRVKAHLVDPASEHRATLSIEGRAAMIEDDELLHLDATGVVSATIRGRDPGARPLFLRTPLLASLKLGGGRYETA
jgi:hypothetical protein